MGGHHRTKHWTLGNTRSKWLVIFKVLVELTECRQAQLRGRSSGVNQEVDCVKETVCVFNGVTGCRGRGGVVDAWLACDASVSCG